MYASNKRIPEEETMRKYELTVLIRPDLESDIEAPINKVRDIVKKAGGEIKKEDNWGKKKLVYKIRKEDFAIYVYMDIILPADAPLKIRNTLNITEEVLRYLLVLADEKTQKLADEDKKSAEDIEE
jgi:ribosomal protein S6